MYKVRLFPEWFMLPLFVISASTQPYSHENEKIIGKIIKACVYVFFYIFTMQNLSLCTMLAMMLENSSSDHYEEIHFDEMYNTV